MERPRVVKRTLDDPDERRAFEKVQLQFVRLGDITLTRMLAEPGWRWSTHVGPIAGTRSCQVHHRGTILEGHLEVEMDDGGGVFDFLPGDVYDIPAGHDGRVVGDVPTLMLEMSTQMGEFGQPKSGERVLATLLFSDVVGSTPLAQRLGDDGWKRLIRDHDVVIRNEVERFRGQVVSTTGDGVFARFDGAARAVHSARAIVEATSKLDLPVRVGVHTGEIEIGRDGLRGIAIHEAARIMALAGPAEILVSDLTMLLAAGSDLEFEDRGTAELRGVSGARHLYAVARPSTAGPRPPASAPSP
jgi:class 3 adenylate cyclase